jgi:hypothetical protein
MITIEAVARDGNIFRMFHPLEIIQKKCEVAY